MMNEEIKTEILDDLIIKLEPPDEITPEFVSVTEDLLVANIKQEHEDSDLNLVKFQPNYVIPQQNVQTEHYRDSIDNNMDLSIFWKAFQDQGIKVQGIKLSSPNSLGSILMKAMSESKLPLKLPLGWNAYFVREQEEVNILFAQMCVENDLPVMKRQIIITNTLQVSLFFGTQKLTNIDLCRKEVKTVECIESIVATFAHYNQCRGISPNVRVERWASVIMLDSSLNKHNFRHLKCNSVSFTYHDQCNYCKYLEIRDMKFAQVRKNKYMTNSMLLNYKSWQNMRKGVAKLKQHVSRLKKENMKLRRRLRRFKNETEKVSK